MFNDLGYCDRTSHWQRCQETVGEKYAVAFLIGCDVGIPTNVISAQRAQMRVAKIIVINPEIESFGNIFKPDVFLQMTALNGLQRIKEIYDSIN